MFKPTQIGANGYRYYGEQALLRLQQILFYRELDLPLARIKQIIDSPGYSELTALQNHQVELAGRIERLQHLLKTVDKTILYLQEKQPLSEQQLFEGFSDEQQAAYEQEAMRLYDPAVVKASNKRWKGYSAAEKQRIGQEGEAVYHDMLRAIPLGADSHQARACVERWRTHMAYFWSPNDEQLIGLADTYNDDPRFRANFDRIDPRLAPFLREAVRYYVAARRTLDQ